MPYTTAGLNAGVGGIAAAGNWIALHTADPAGVAGASQHGSRAQTTWAAASGGSQLGSQVSISVAAGTTISYWSVNTASTGGSMLWSAALSAADTFGSAGTEQLTPTVSVTN